MASLSFEILQSKRSYDVGNSSANNNISNDLCTLLCFHSFNVSGSFK